MTPPTKPPSLYERCFVTLGMAAILGWAGWAVYRSDLFWLKVAAGVFVGLFLLMGAFIAWMMAAQWRDKRRAAREGREWRP